MATHTSTRRRKPLKPNAPTLACLGAERLAELLATAARSDARLKRRLALEVLDDAADLADELDKQAQRLRTATSRLNAPRAAATASDVNQLVAMTVTKLGTKDPAAAAERLLQLLEAAPAILARRTGEGRTLVEAFSAIGAHVAGLLPSIPVGEGRIDVLATACRLSLDNETGPTANLISAVSGAGTAHDRACLRKLVERELAILEAAGGRPGATAHRVQRLTEALAAIADADGDVDAFRAAHERRDPRLRDHLAITDRLLAAGRSAEALQVLEAAPAGAVRASQPYAEARITALEALGRRDEAQAERWTLFWAALSVDALRGFLKRLPDFEDVEHEEAALAHAEQHRDATASLGFLVAWPDHRRAAALVRRRIGQLNGSAAEALAAAAEKLAFRDPLAATLLYRQILDAALPSGCGDAANAKVLLECASLAGTIADWEGRPEHLAYVSRLRARYGRQKRFWRKVAAGG